MQNCFANDVTHRMNARSGAIVHSRKYFCEQRNVSDRTGAAHNQIARRTRPVHVLMQQIEETFATARADLLRSPLTAI